MSIPFLLGGLVLLAKRSKAEAMAERIRKDIPPPYKPSAIPNEQETKRLQALLNKVNDVVHDTDCVVVEIKNRRDKSHE